MVWKVGELGIGEFPSFPVSHFGFRRLGGKSVGKLMGKWFRNGEGGNLRSWKTENREKLAVVWKVGELASFPVSEFPILGFGDWVGNRLAN